LHCRARRLSVNGKDTRLWQPNWCSIVTMLPKRSS
jgi:hypothetical protein